jgi:hypothetical protein
MGEDTLVMWQCEVPMYREGETLPISRKLHRVFEVGRQTMTTPTANISIPNSFLRRKLAVRTDVN